jgi:hypothetical protein
MVTRLETLLRQNREMGEKRRQLKVLQQGLKEEIDVLLGEAEAKRKAHPTPGAEAQTVG